MFDVNQLFSPEEVEAMNSNKNLLLDEESDNDLLDVNLEEEDVQSTNNVNTSKKGQDADAASKENREDTIDVNKIFVDTEDLNTKDTEINLSEEKYKEPVKAFAKYLADEGILEVEQEEIEKLESTAQLKEFLENTLKRRELNDLTDAQKEYLELIRAGVDESVVKQYQVNQSKLNSITEEDLKASEDLQKNAYATLLKQKGFDDDKVVRYIKRAIDTNTLLEESKDAIAELIENEKKFIEEEKQKNLEAENKAREEQNKVIEDIKKKLKEGYKLSDDFVITSKEADSVLKSIQNPVVKVNGQNVNIFKKYIEDDPVGYRIKMHYLASKGFFDKDAKLDFLTKNVTTKKVNDLDKVLFSISDEDINFSGSKTTTKKDQEGINALISAIDRI